MLYFHYIRCKRTMELGGERLGVNLDLVETKTFFLQSTFSLLSTSFHAAWFSADLYSACNCDRRLRADNLQVESRRGGLAGGREWMCAKKCVFVSSRQWFAKAGSLVLCYCYRGPWWCFEKTLFVEHLWISGCPLLGTEVNDHWPTICCKGKCLRHNS